MRLFIFYPFALQANQIFTTSILPLPSLHRKAKKQIVLYYASIVRYYLSKNAVPKECGQRNCITRRQQRRGLYFDHQCVAINETYSRGKLIYLLLLELRIFVMKTTLTFEKSPQSLDTVIRLRGSKST